MNILHLTLKKKWFDMILSGEKKEEYREYKPYWISRFDFHSIDDYQNRAWEEEMRNLPDIIHFTNGYGKHRPSFMIEVNDWSLAKSTHPEWGGDTTKYQFIFNLGKIIKPIDKLTTPEGDNR